ncbi:MAG: undecaprenyldiphospho-muramoylpentapeptide beta-N-acetylglucosaminyltransferase [Candidatus Nealsonbacteria bacterium]
MKIVFTGGGTAGHIMPIIAIIREIKKAHSEKDIHFFYVGPKDKFAESLFIKEGVIIKTILAGKLRRYFSFQNVIDIFFKFPIGIIQSFFHIFVISPDVVFSKGGYGSLPVVISSWLLLTPIFMHESDASPGLANKIGSRFSLEIFTAFPAEKTEYFPAKKMIFVGNPVREEIIENSSEQAKQVFKLTGEKPVILILGGSQGAKIINDRILLVLSDLLDSFEVIHQTGKANFEQVKREAEVVVHKNLEKYYHLFPFLNEKEITYAYQISDIIISRAGAGSIFEIALVGKPSILVPLSGSAQNHQIKNAYIYAENKACIVMEEDNFTPHFLLERLKFLFSNKEKLEEMSKKAKEFSKPNSARIIANYVVAYLYQ